MRVPKSTMQSTALLLVLGLGMILVLFIVSRNVLNTGDSNSDVVIIPTPTPEINYEPIPSDGSSTIPTPTTFIQNNNTEAVNEINPF